MKLKQKKLTGRSIRIGFGGIILVVITGALLWGAYFQSQKEIFHQEKEQLMTVSKSVASGIENYVQGYALDLKAIAKSDEFTKAVKTFSSGGGNAELCRMFRQFAGVQKAEVSDLYLLNAQGNFLAGTSSTFLYTIEKKGTVEPGKESTDILKDKSGNYYVAVSIPPFSGNHLMMVLNVKTMYTKIASFIKMGKKGYVMIKTSTGIIIMHPVQEQIGEDVILDRKKQYPNYDFTDLEALIEHQKEGKSDVEIYYSYWWADNVPKKVKKIAAYMPARLANDFLIVSTVIDYDEIAKPLLVGTVKMIVICFVMVLGIGGLLIAFVDVGRNREKYRRENLYLKKLNGRLKELHKSEEQISHYQRLQTIGTLTSGIAHEFNNLLTPIMGYSGMLLQSVPKDNDAYEDMKEIYASSVRAKEIIQQISGLSRKNVETVFSRFNIQSAILRAIKIADSAKPANVGIVQDIRLQNCFVMGNETQIDQVMLNLCTNAFHAMGKAGGTLSISGEIVENKDVPAAGWPEKSIGRYARLVLQDTGCGIDPSVLSRIFDPFFTTKKAGEGTGLGLSIAQNIIESHNGKITVSSKLGKGTVFTFYLPLCGSQSAKPQMPQVFGQNHFQSILVVDNNKRILHMLQKGLARYGLAVTCFSSPKEALNDLKTHSYDILVTDYSMPEMLGTQLAFSAKEINPQMRILIMAGLVTEEVIESKQKEIIDDYIFKPLVCDDLVKKMNNLPVRR